MFCDVFGLNIIHKYGHEYNEQVRGKGTALPDTGALFMGPRDPAGRTHHEGGVFINTFHYLEVVVRETNPA